MLKIIIAYCTVMYGVSAIAHGGGTLKSGEFKGCHTNRNSGEFHCHSKSKYNGRKWKSKAEAESQSTAKAVKESNAKEKYNRKEWGVWRDEDGNCLNTRHEILKTRSLVPVKINGCRVISGKWNDFYFSEVLSSSSEVDIDHVVPVHHAFYHGAKNWSQAEKAKFYNDFENLVITNKKYNRQKGSNDFTSWSPVNKTYACKYAKKWFYIKQKYKLVISEKELVNFRGMGCE